MEFVCSLCGFQIIGPPDLDGTRCPECADGELGVVGRPPIEDVLRAEGWHEAADAAHDIHVSMHRVNVLASLSDEAVERLAAKVRGMTQDIGRGVRP